MTLHLLDMRQVVPLTLHVSCAGLIPHCQSGELQLKGLQGVLVPGAHRKPERLEHIGSSALASLVIMIPARAKPNADRMNVVTNPAVFFVLLDDMVILRDC